MRQVTGKSYEIGGVCVKMAAHQAEAWNAGNVAAETLKGALVYLPSRIGGGSRLIDGEVVVDDGLPKCEVVDLWEAIGGENTDSDLYRDFMDGMPANRIS